MRSATPIWGDMNIGKYVALEYPEENEGYMTADRMNWRLRTETSWKCAPGKAWSMLERQQTGVGAEGEPYIQLHQNRKASALAIW